MENSKKIFLHLGIDDISEESLVKSLEKGILNNLKATVFTANVDFFRNSYNDLPFRKALNSSTYLTIDGKIAYFLAKIFHSKIKNNISGSDLAIPLLEMLNKNNFSLVIIGGKAGVAEKAKKNILNRYNNISKISTYSPIFGFENDTVETLKIINFLKNENPNCVLFCCGSPKSELFLNRNYKFLPNSIFLSVGATVDFLAGTIKRAPKWMSKIGLEWLYRLTKDPKRLFKRYLLDFIFLFKIFFVRLFNKKKLLKKYYDSI